METPNHQGTYVGSVFSPRRCFLFVFFSIQKMLLCLTRELVHQEVLPDPILWGQLFEFCF